MREAAAVRRDERFAQRQQRSDQRRFFDDPPQHGGDVVGTAAHVGAEQRGADDGQGEAPHLGRDLDLRAGGPFVGEPRAFGDHALGIGCDLRAMKSGLQHPPALAMTRFFARHQSVADEFAQQRGAGVARETVLAAHENLFDELRLVDDVDPRAQDAKAGDGTVTPRGRRQERNDAVRFRAEEAKRFPAPRSGRHLHVDFDARAARSVARRVRQLLSKRTAPCTVVQCVKADRCSFSSLPRASYAPGSACGAVCPRRRRRRLQRALPL